MKNIIIAICLLFCGCQLWTEGDVIGHLDVKHFKAVRIFEVGSKIYLLGNLEKIDTKTAGNGDPVYLKTDPEYVVYELVGNGFSERFRGKGKLADAFVSDQTITLAINIKDNESHSVKIASYGGDLSLVGSLNINSKCRKVISNKDGIHLFVLNDYLVLTNSTYDVLMLEKFDYVASPYDELYALANGDFIFKSSNKIYNLDVDRKLLIERPSKDYEQIFYLDKEDLLLAVERNPDDKLVVDMFKGSSFAGSFETEFRTINKFLYPGELILSGRDSSFGTQYCTYSMDGSLEGCFRPRLGGDWPYYLTAENKIVSYTSGMVQMIRVP